MANNFPNLLPSLNLDLVNGIYVDPRITFTRAGGRTFFDEEMVKAEENLLLQSQTFDSGSWTKTSSTITANTTVAPDGTTTADTLTLNSADAASLLFQTVTPVSSQTYTVSAYIKAGTGTQIRVQSNLLSTGAYITVDTSTGAILDSNAIVVSSEFTSSAPNGFFRIGFSVVANTSFISSAVIFRGVTGVTLANDTIIVWQAQAEQRSFVTAPTVTTTQPITRYQRLLKTAAANEWPREFDPVTGECLGRSVWESRTNLVLRSEEFDNAAWTKDAVSISANQIIAPDGTLGADKLVEDTNNVPHFVYTAASITLTGGLVYTLTWHLKAAERTTATIGSGSSRLLVNTTVDLSAGTITSSAASSSSIQNIGNGWYRVRATQTCGSTGGIQPLVYLQTTAAYAGDGTSGIYIWGAMLETGAFATPYIPTVASQVTRVADSAVMTGVNFSSWYRQDEGAFFVEAQVPSTGGSARRMVSANLSGASANSIQVAISSTGLAGYYEARINNAADVAATNGTIVSGAVFKSALSYKVNDYAFSTNGAAVGTDTSALVPEVNQIEVGTHAATKLNGYIKRLTYYPQALTSANLQAVTR